MFKLVHNNKKNMIFLYPILLGIGKGNTVMIYKLPLFMLFFLLYELGM